MDSADTTEVRAEDLETDVSPEVAAPLLFRAAYLIRGQVIPTESDLVVLSDRGRVWTHDFKGAA